MLSRIWPSCLESSEHLFFRTIQNTCFWSGIENEVGLRNKLSELYLKSKALNTILVSANLILKIIIKTWKKLRTYLFWIHFEEHNLVNFFKHFSLYVEQWGRNNKVDEIHFHLPTGYQDCFSALFAIDKEQW